MKRLIAVLCAALMLLAAGVAAAAARVPVYRVGYTPTPGFFTRAQDGSCHGSGYAYLEELSLYAGCRFDYVELPLGQEFDRLRAGEVDILIGSSGRPFSDLLYSHHDIARPALELSLSDNAQRDLADTPPHRLFRQDPYGDGAARLPRALLPRRGLHARPLPEPPRDG
ncbi:hypothetical protein [Selenomonas sp.]|jgi:ABC-type amino acid transport substrate-binding protein|uniref:hypothetical protein n=1 Tax=Selenomonas sp. TaxID=2053611 RepID=UPI003A101A06